MLYDILIRLLAAFEIGIILNADGITNPHVVMSVCVLLCLEFSLLCRRRLPSGIAAADLIAALPFAAALFVLLIEERQNSRLSLALLLLFFLSYILETLLLRKLSACLDRLHNTRDAGVEVQSLLQDRNRRLLQEQDHEIHLATLKERNRIAREIHDNVGHMLSRAILLLGAIETCNKDPDTAPRLALLGRTLDESMQKMRESVHDLHDDSIDPEKTLRDMLEDLHGFRKTLDIELKGPLPSSVKLALLGIFREAVTNIVRHSNGDSVTVVVHRNPDFCTLSVTDNGTSFCADQAHSGIGLSNMRQRAKACGGDVYFYHDNGFTVYARLPY
jgi:signal transduction histidine kinase